eukprot:6189434-Pleurochrysis_carterae.AAC.1
MRETLEIGSNRVAKLRKGELIPEEERDEQQEHPNYLYSIDECALQAADQRRLANARAWS